MNRDKKEYIPCLYFDTVYLEDYEIKVPSKKVQVFRSDFTR